jgi:hypothetical protein
MCMTWGLQEPREARNRRTAGGPTVSPSRNAALSASVDRANPGSAALEKGARRPTTLGGR